MVTPESMAELAKSNSFDGCCAKRLKQFERDIESAARLGFRSTLLCYTDCGAASLTAIKALQERGFRVTVRRETIGDVLQHPGFYAEW